MQWTIFSSGVYDRERHRYALAVYRFFQVYCKVQSSLELPILSVIVGVGVVKNVGQSERYSEDTVAKGGRFILRMTSR